jgi:hypothetical protein
MTYGRLASGKPVEIFFRGLYDLLVLDICDPVRQVSDNQHPLLSPSFHQALVLDLDLKIVLVFSLL